eukprot:11923420-Alexandrium_andersonii.AAC.1
MQYPHQRKIPGQHFGAHNDTTTRDRLVLPCESAMPMRRCDQSAINKISIIGKGSVQAHLDCGSGVQTLEGAKPLTL